MEEGREKERKQERKKKKYNSKTFFVKRRIGKWIHTNMFRSPKQLVE
jgi:hypothetical protein